jgi:3-phosphoshikimate 1-carboxyvinyltransferase
MRIISEKSILRGEVQIPASKSHTIRAVVISSLAYGKSIIHHPLLSSDVLAAMCAGRAFGVKIESNKSWEVEGINGIPRIPDKVIDTHNSGTTMNFFMGVASLVDGTAVLTGDEQIVRRPVHESRLRGCPVRGYADHRVVMALAIAGMSIPGRTPVDTAESIAVTFPILLN